VPFGKDLDLRGYNWDHTIQIAAIGTVQSYEDLGPLLDEFAKRYNNFTSRVTAFEPPAASFTEIAVSLSWIVDTAREHPIPTYFALRFIDTLLEDGARRIRSEISRITREARVNQHGRRFVPFELNLGRLKYLFHRPVDEPQLAAQLKAIKEAISSLPSDIFIDESRGQFADWFFWDRELACWRRAEEGERGSFPDDLWLDD
jgi:hypothetical protein